MSNEEPKAEKGHNSKNVDWTKIAAIINKDIANTADKMSKARGDMSAAKKRIEELGANKRGANFVIGLLNAGDATSSDILHTVCHLCHELGVGIMRDMVDEAEGKAGYTIPLIETPSVDV